MKGKDKLGLLEDLLDRINFSVTMKARM